MKFGIDNIRGGTQYSTATQMPVRTGKATVATVTSYFQGQQVPKYNYLPMSVITKQNVEEFAAACTY
jgi:ABC-type sugar transport system substrate-binding protein